MSTMPAIPSTTDTTTKHLAGKAAFSEQTTSQIKGASRPKSTQSAATGSMQSSAQVQNNPALEPTSQPPPQGGTTQHPNEAATNHQAQGQAQFQQQHLPGMYSPQLLHPSMIDPFMQQAYMFYHPTGMANTSSPTGMQWVPSSHAAEGSWVPAATMAFDPFLAAAAQQQAIMATLLANQNSGVDLNGGSQEGVPFYIPNSSHAGLGATNMHQNFKVSQDHRGNRTNSESRRSNSTRGTNNISGGRISFSSASGKVIGTEHFASIVNQDELPQRPGVQDCAFYLQHGRCAYGSMCKFNHPPEVAKAQQPAAYNALGLPLRPGVQDCAYYMKTASCKFGSTCKFHHPDLGIPHDPRMEYAARQQFQHGFINEVDQATIQAMQQISLQHRSDTPEPEQSPKLQSEQSNAKANNPTDGSINAKKEPNSACKQNVIVERKCEDKVDTGTPLKAKKNECEPELPPSPVAT